jgi:hypothetical protein
MLALTAQLTMAAEELDWRTWTSTSGTKIEGRVVKISGQSVTLERKEGGAELTVKFSQLIEADRKFLSEIPETPEEKGATSIDGIDAKPGSISPEIKCVKDEEWSYHVYLPKEFHTGRQWPVCFIMSPGGGGGGGAIKRYITGADRLGIVLALSVQSKNNFWESSKPMAAMADDVYERFPVLDSLGLSTGFSGGSRMAYLLAERDKRIAGVVACGSGAGVYLAEKDFRQAKLRKSTYIYSLMGTNCFNRGEASTSHSRFSKNFRLRFFPGGHSWAGSPYLDEAMARVMGEALAQNKSKDLDDLRERYSRIMWKWTQELREKQPWEAAAWAEFLEGFKGDSQVSRAAGRLAAELAKDPEALRGKEAQKALEKFAEKRLLGSSDLRKDGASTEKKADVLADEHEGLPHAELIRKLGRKG